MNAPSRPVPARTRWRYNARELATRPDLVPVFVDAPAPVHTDDSDDHEGDTR